MRLFATKLEGILKFAAQFTCPRIIRFIIIGQILDKFLVFILKRKRTEMYIIDANQCILFFDIYITNPVDSVIVVSDGT
ncbi:hypothetical protein D3C73_564980 [compost metagenome]